MNNNLKKLASFAARGTAPEGYTNEDVKTAFKALVREKCGTLNDFERNKYDIYDIIIENVDDIVPTKTLDIIGSFAEVRHFAQGEKAIFKTGRGSLGRQRAKKFITSVALSGVYESFRLDSDVFTVGMSAIGTGVSIDFERMLDGSDSLADLMDIVAEGMVERVLIEVQAALRAALTAANVPSANRVIASSFDPDQMMSLVNTVKAYSAGAIGRSGSAVIFAPPEFIAAMGPDAIVPSISGAAQGVYHPDDIDAIHKTGYIKLFRGTPIVELPQSFVDASNSQVWIDPQMAYVLPTGNEKVVKVAYEGTTHILEHRNRDFSYEFQIYRKMGVGISTYHNWGIYQNTGIDNSAFYDPALY